MTWCRIGLQYVPLTSLTLRNPEHQYPNFSLVIFNISRLAIPPLHSMHLLIIHSVKDHSYSYYANSPSYTRIRNKFPLVWLGTPMLERVASSIPSKAAKFAALLPYLAKLKYVIRFSERLQFTAFVGVAIHHFNQTYLSHRLPWHCAYLRRQ